MTDQEINLTQWVPPRQLRLIKELAEDKEEGEHYLSKMEELKGHIKSMPSLEGEEEPGSKAYLRYFNMAGSTTVHIYAKDFPYAGNEKGDQHQAFGHVDIFGDGGELGYVSLPEIFKVDTMEIDLNFTPGERVA